jgi:hypothetical protein
MERIIEIAIPIGRPAYISTDEARYDAKGNWLGREVKLIEQTFSREEAARLRRYQGCLECGGIGEHKSYFVETSQHPGGTVEGYTKQCSKGGHNG